MSYEINKKLGTATEKIGELQSAYEKLKENEPFRRERNFTNLMNVIGSFFTDEIDFVYVAMDNAFDEIDRLDVENDKLREQIKELEK